MSTNHISTEAAETLTDSFNRRLSQDIDHRQMQLEMHLLRAGKGAQALQKSEILSSDEIIRIVHIASKYGARKVRLTGGGGDIIPLISGIKAAGAHGPENGACGKQNRQSRPLLPASL
jgi:mevalonate kinase